MRNISPSYSSLFSNYEGKISKKFSSSITNEIAKSYRNNRIDENTYKAVMALLLSRYINDNFNEYFNELMNKYQNQ